MLKNHDTIRSSQKDKYLTDTYSYIEKKDHSIDSGEDFFQEWNGHLEKPA